MTDRKSENTAAQDAAGSRARFAYDSLLAAILGGDMKSGERIRETEVAEQLQISRTPVREALRRLEAEGLVTVDANSRGLVIASLSYQEVMELYQMREVLEGTAAALAARHASDAEVEVLCDLLEAKPNTTGGPALHAERNRRFHNALYHAAHNRYLLKSLNSLRDALALLGTTTFTLPDRPAAAHAEHARILKAINERDPEAAEQRAREHIRAAQRARLKLLRLE